MKTITKPEIKIIVACHKNDPNIRKGEHYVPIQVGKSLHPDLDLGLQCDNTGDNISEKNGAYCELTALYWAWKNLDKCDYAGLCHYRRYFDYDLNNLANDMNKYDIIIPNQKHLSTNIVTELALLTCWEDVYIFIDSILKKLPESKGFIYDYFYRTNKFTVCNMFLTDKNNFDRYCEFLFGILSDVEKYIKTNGYFRLRRVIGYLAEPLLGFWIKYNNLRVKMVGVSDPEDTMMSDNSLKNKIRQNISFYAKHFAFRKCNPNFFGDWVINGLKQDGIIIQNPD